MSPHRASFFAMFRRLIVGDHAPIGGIALIIALSGSVGGQLPQEARVIMTSVKAVKTEARPVFHFAGQKRIDEFYVLSAWKSSSGTRGRNVSPIFKIEEKDTKHRDDRIAAMGVAPGEAYEIAVFVFDQDESGRQERISAADELRPSWNVPPAATEEALALRPGAARIGNLSVVSMDPNTVKQLAELVVAVVQKFRGWDEDDFLGGVIFRIERTLSGQLWLSTFGSTGAGSASFQEIDASGALVRFTGDDADYRVRFRITDVVP